MLINKIQLMTSHQLPRGIVPVDSKPGCSLLLSVVRDIDPLS